MQNYINNKPRNYEELEKIITQTAKEEIGLFNNKNNEVYTNKKRSPKTLNTSKGRI